MKLYLDLETRSVVDLKKCGVYVYAESPSTEILVWSYAIDDGPLRLYYPHWQPFPEDLRSAIVDPATSFIAHNASFERIIFTVVGKRGLLPEIWSEMKKIERWTCTAARARACGLPGALDLLGRALRLQVQKDKEGYTLMMRMCKPRALDDKGLPVWYGSEADFLRLGEYCARDTDVERTLDHLLPELSPKERALWMLTERMNDRGIRVDNALLMKLLVLVEDAVLALNAKLAKKTNNVVKRVSDAGALRRWLAEQGFDEIEESGIGKAVILEMLEDASLDPLVQEVLCIRRDGGKSSTAKFKAIANRTNADGNIRGNLMYCGASSSSRFTGNGAQLQNLPRNRTIKDLRKVLTPLMERELTVNDIEASFGPPMVVISELIRPVFMAPDGYWMVRGDYSQVEARLLQALAGAEDKLENFRKYDRGEGPDVYITTASRMFGIPVEQISKDSEPRQFGKVGVLAGGYGGGKRAFVRFAKQNGLEMSEEEAERQKVLFREANPEVVEFWRVLENTALTCLEAPAGTTHEVRPGMWFKRNALCMTLRLWSEEHLFFWYPKIEEAETPWGVTRKQMTFWSEDGLTHQWTKFKAYGGMLAAMATQKTARDLMAYALLEMDRRGLKPVLTVHDEGVGLAAKSVYPTPLEAASAVRDAMLTLPDWCAHVPIAVDASAAERYIKA